MFIYQKLIHRNKLSQRLVWIAFEPQHKRDRIISIVRGLEDDMRKSKSIINIHCTQDFSNRLFELNPKYFEYISDHFITEEMIEIIIKLHPELLDRVDIPYYNLSKKNINIINSIIEEHKIKDLKDGMSERALKVFVNAINKDLDMIRFVPKKYSDKVKQITGIIPGPLSGHTNLIGVEYEKRIRKSVQDHTELLEEVESNINYQLWSSQTFMEEDGKFQSVRSKYNYITISHKDTDQKLCNLLHKLNYSHKIPKEYITRSIFNDIKDDAEERGFWHITFMAWMDVPDHFEQELIKFTVENEPLSVTRMSQDRIKKIPFDMLVKAVRQNPYVINYVDEDRIESVLREQNKEFFCTETLDCMFKFYITGKLYNELFGHIPLYWVKAKGKRLHGFYVESKDDNYGIPDGSGVYSIPKNSGTWNPEWLAYHHKVKDYKTILFRIRDDCEVVIDAGIQSVVVLDKKENE